MFKLLIILMFVHASLCAKSFTILLDTTGSMKDEISAIKANIDSVVNAVNKSDYTNFILVSFKDSAVEAPYITQTAHDFTSHVGSISTSGGNDCPENFLAGLEAALRASEQPSTIFVFTDAFAKDYNNFNTVERLCKETHSEVIIFLSGSCLTGYVGNVEVYYDVAKVCSGAVLKFESIYELRKQAFKHMKEIINTDWSHVNTYDTFTGFKQIAFTAETFTTDLMIVVAGNYPAVEILRGNLPITKSTQIAETTNALVVRIRPVEAGTYTVNIRAREALRVTIYERNHVPFEFGFSTKSPRSIKETAARPIQGYTNYLLINVANSFKLHSVEWLNYRDSVKQILLLKQIPSGSYVASVFVEPGKMFQFWIIGEETTTMHAIKGSSKLLSPQVPVNELNVRHIKPEAEILDTEIGLVDFGAELKLACKVNGYPRPNISWEDESNGNEYPSETVLLEIPSVYISYVTVANVTKNITIVCNAANSVARTYETIDVYVNRTFTFEVIYQPEDAFVEYGNEHYLNCKVNAYPEATVKWYFNDSLIDTYTNSRVHIQDNALVIKNMDFEDVGSYKCKVSNEVESRTFEAAIDISGVEAPEIKQVETGIALKPGDKAEFECRTSKGKPAPVIAWEYYKSLKDEDCSLIPYGVVIVGGKVKISSIQKSHAGIYKCTASNPLGESNMKFDIQIQFPPVIRNGGSQTLVVKKDDRVSLDCDVEATPEATVRWEMTQDDVIIPLDERHETDERYTHSFTAQGKDSGNYHCVAENNVGKAEKTIFVNVLVPPYIQTPESKLIHANIGDSVSLICNIITGNPAPTILWEFTAKESTTATTLNRDNSTNNLYLTKLLRSQEGTYMCIAVNQISIDRISYELVVQ